MSELLTRELRRRLLAALAAVPITDTPQGRATLLANLPPRLQDQIACDGPKATAISTMIQVLERVDELESGESALCLVIEAARDTVEGAELGRELEDILNSLGGGASRLAALRAAYTDHLRAKYAPANLRGLLPAEYARLHGTTVLLRDIYVPLTASAVERIFADPDRVNGVLTVNVRRGHMTWEQKSLSSTQSTNANSPAMNKCLSPRWLTTSRWWSCWVILAPVSLHSSNNTPWAYLIRPRDCCRSSCPFPPMPRRYGIRSR